MLQFLDSLIDAHTIHPRLQFHAEQILLRILIPCCVWKAGKQNSSVRKCAIVGIHKLLAMGLLDRDLAYKNFKALFAVLKSCVEDEWAADLRLASCSLMNTLIAALAPLLSGTVSGMN